MLGEGQDRTGRPLLRVLGPCALELDGLPTRIGGPRPQAVLVRLALAEGRLVTAERLVDDLWGDHAPASVTGTLHGYVSRLRAALGDPTRLRREGPGYVLDLADDEVDARRFESLVDEAGVIHGEPARAIALLDRALGLWRGSALVDVAHTGWAGPSAVRLEERRLEAVEARFGALLDLGRHGAAVPELEQAVTDHPLRERFTAQLMTALYRSGRQADALRAFERCRRTLLDESGLELSAELVALEAAILAHDPALQRPAPADRSADRSSRRSSTEPAPPTAPGDRARPSVPPAVRRLSASRFVGRIDALADVAKEWDQVVAGHRRLLLVEGEAGSGKTRLAAQVAASLHEEGAIVLWGRSAEEAILPYGPFVEALRTSLADASEARRSQMFADHPGLASLRPLVLGERSSDGHGSLGVEGEGIERYQLFEALAALVHDESRQAPVLLVIDDLQWADRPTLRLLQHLLQHSRPSRLLLLATVRTAPTTDNPALESLLWEARRDHLLGRLGLEGLAPDEVAELLGLGLAAEPQRVHDICATTRGNPFFVIELAGHVAGGPVPDSVRDVLAARLGRVASDTIRLLSAAAVAGAAAPLQVLGAASGLDGEAVLDALDEAIAAGLLTEDADDAVAFQHGLVQQLVNDRLTGLRRRGIHLAVAEAYEAGEGRAIDVAHHLVAAGPLASASRTAVAAVAAGWEAASLHAYEEAADWATRAVELGGDEDAAVRAQALLLRSAAQRALGDREAARTTASLATEAARASGRPLLVASAAEAAMLVRAGLGFDFETSDAELPALLAEALHGLTVDAQHPMPELAPADPFGGGDIGLRWLPRAALALAEANGHHALVATAHLTVRMSIWRVDALAQRLEADRLGLAAATRANQPSMVLNALLYLATDLSEAGEVAGAAIQLEHIRTVAARLRQPAYDAFVDFFDAQLALGRGDYEQATELVDRGLLAGRQSHGGNADLAWAGHVFIRAWDQGRLADVLPLLDAAGAETSRATIFQVGRSLALVAAGRGEEARATLTDDLASCWLDVDHDSLWLAIGGLLAELCRALHEPEAAATVAEHLRPYTGRLAIMGMGRASLGPVDRFLGLAVAVTGDLAEAERLLRRAVDQADFGGATVHEARALADLAEVVDASGGRAGEAAEVRDRALALAAPLGLVLDPIAAQATTEPGVVHAELRLPPPRPPDG